ncbi:MAG: hypothetical protein QXJ23_09540 [Thermofilum sp.]|uniref:hypothetical protein n=1 Tax=Thermofilum sp. TaxID=1961369 RepID=UPI00316BB483
MASALFAPYLAVYLDAIFGMVENALWGTQYSPTMSTLSGAFLPVYRLIRALLTNQWTLTFLLGLTMVTMAFKVVREPA